MKKGLILFLAAVIGSHTVWGQASPIPLPAFNNKPAKPGSVYERVGSPIWQDQNAQERILPLFLSSAAELATSAASMVLYDGSMWVRKPGTVNVASLGYGGVVLPGVAGMYYERLFFGPVNAKYFGAVGNGSTNDTQAILNALASPYAKISLEKGIYGADEITVPAGKTLLIEESALLRQRAYSNTVTKALVRLSTGSKLTGSGVVDGNSGVLAASRSNLSAQNYGISIDGDSVEINGITTKNTISLSLWAHGRKALKIANYTEVGVGRGAMFLRCENVAVTNYVHRESNMIFAQVYQHCLDFIYCGNVHVSGAKFLNVNSGPAAPSSAISGLTLLGCWDSSYENLIFNGFLSTVNVALPIADDGSTNSYINGVVITGWKYDVGVEVQGSHYCAYSNFLIDGTVLSNTASGPVGLHVLDTGIMGGMLTMATGDIQSRDRTAASNNTFTNISVIGGYAGFRVAGSDNLFQNCTASGHTYGWRIQQKQGGPLTNFWQSPVLQRVNDNLFVDCSAGHSSVGFLFWGGDNNRLIRPKALNCTQGFANFINLQSNVSAATSTTATLSTSATANAWKNFQLFITNGTGTGQIRKIVSHTTTTYTVDAAWGVTPDATSEAVVVDNPQGTIWMESPMAIDNQNFTLTGAATFPLIDTNPANLTAITVATGGERIAYNQKIKLKNCITGASSPDLIVRVSGLDKTTRDRLLITPLTLGDGSAVGGILAPTLTAGTGTVTTSNWTAFQTQLGQVDGSGTDLPGEIDAHYWIKVNGEWRQVLKANSATQYTLTQAVTTPGSGLPFQICKVDIEGIPSMTNGVAFNRYYGDVSVSGELRIEGALSAPFNTFRSRSAGALELTPNSTTPSVQMGTLFRTNNSSATAYTGFTGATIGKRITILVTDANTTFAYVVGNLKGYSVNYAASIGDVLTATYDGTQWLTQIVPSGGRFKLFEFGDPNATSPVLKQYGGGGGADFGRLIRTLGLNSEFGYGVSGTGYYINDVTNSTKVFTAGMSGTTKKVTIGNDQAVAVGGASRLSAQSVTGGVTNSPGGVLELSAGKGTGDAAAGSVDIYTPDPVASGTGQQTESIKMRVSPQGKVLVGRTTNVTGALAVWESTTEGILPPRMTAAQRAAITPGNAGVLLIQTDGVSGLWRWTGSAWVSVSGASGTATTSGNGSATVFTIAHGLGYTPTALNVQPGSVAAAGSYFVTSDATNLTVTYSVAPASGTNNVVINWFAR